METATSKDCNGIAQNYSLHLYRMKLISVILAVLMLYLSGMPCDDVEVADNDGTVTYALAQDGHDHDGDSPESDGCSPFCVCHCCHTHIVIPNHPLTTSVAVHNNQDKPSYYQDFYPNGIIYAIWRPPQSA